MDSIWYKPLHTEITVKGHQPGFLPVIHCSPHQGEILSKVAFLFSCTLNFKRYTVKRGIKELLNKEQTGFKELFLITNPFIS